MTVKDLYDLKEKEQILLQFLTSVKYELSDMKYRIEKDEFTTIIAAAKADGVREFIEAVTQKLNNIK